MFNKSKNKGFSLVELIVIIAILVVFAAILIPSLLQYTENSRAQKDESAMDEVVNAFQLAMADEKCYDEVLKYSCENNYLTYSDSSGNYGQVIADGEFWAPDGSGRATTITFNPEYGPNNQIIYNLSKGLVNDMTYGNGSVGQDRTMQGSIIDINQCYFNKLIQTYNMVRQTVGNDVITTSQTYRNSSFTIFIRFNQKDNTTIAEVNGSFNGTNLYDGADAAVGSGTTTYEPETGNAMTTTGGGIQSSNYTTSTLGGSGSVNFVSDITTDIPDYKESDYVDNLQKENPFKYYSSLVLAIDDVNNNTIGANADCDKDDAVAGIYDNDGVISVVLLKDWNMEKSDTITIKQDITLVLGGNKITKIYSGNGEYYTFVINNAKLIVDARVFGSQIVVENSNTKYGINIFSVASNASLQLIEGEYYCKSALATAYAVGSATDSKSIDYLRCTILAEGFDNANASNLRSENISIKDCDITSIRTCIDVLAPSQQTISSRGISCSDYKKLTISNSKISLFGSMSDVDDNDNDELSHSSFALALGDGQTEIKNCDIYSTNDAIHVSSCNSDMIVKNSRVYCVGRIVSMYKGTTTNGLYLDNVTATQSTAYLNDYLYSISNHVYKCAITNYGANLYINDCNLSINDSTHALYAQSFGNVYISKTQITKQFKVYLDNDSKFYIGLRNGFASDGILSGWNNLDNIVETNSIYSYK